jgi:sugar phosphate permease
MSSQKLAFGISFTLLGVGAGGAFTPMFVAWTAQHWGWRTSFLLCGLLGLLVSLVWALYATNRPAEPASNYDPNVGIERQLSNSHRDPRLGDLASTRVPWRKIFGSGSVWALLLSYMCRAYAMFFFDTWFFIYLVRVRGLTVIRGGLWASTPYLAVLLFSPFGGLVSDFAVNRFGRRRGRQAAVWLGMACSGILVLIGCHTANNAVAILLVAAAAGFNMFANVTWWATCIDVMPNHAASLAGLMNMCGGIAGLIAPILTAYIATSFGWAAALDFIAILCAAGGLLWIFVNAEKQLEEGATLTLEEQNAKSIS